MLRGGLTRALPVPHSLKPAEQAGSEKRCRQDSSERCILKSDLGRLGILRDAVFARDADCAQSAVVRCLRRAALRRARVQAADEPNSLRAPEESFTASVLPQPLRDAWPTRYAHTLGGCRIAAGHSRREVQEPCALQQSSWCYPHSRALQPRSKLCPPTTSVTRSTACQYSTHRLTGLRRVSQTQLHPPKTCRQNRQLCSCG